MDDDALLRLEYDRTTALLDGLTETRFKLLALVPTIAGATVGFLSAGTSGLELIAVGTLGLTATGGVLLYELRNGELKRSASDRLLDLEARLFGRASREGEAGRLFGLVRVSHERGVALVYGAALAAWTYVVTWGVLRALDVPSPRIVGLAVGAVAGLAVFLDVERLEERRAEPGGAQRTGLQPS